MADTRNPAVTAQIKKAFAPIQEKYGLPDVEETLAAVLQKNGKGAAGVGIEYFMATTRGADALNPDVLKEYRTGAPQPTTDSRTKKIMGYSLQLDPNKILKLFTDGTVERTLAANPELVSQLKVVAQVGQLDMRACLAVGGGMDFGETGSRCAMTASRKEANAAVHALLGKSGKVELLGDGGFQVTLAPGTALATGLEPYARDADGKMTATTAQQDAFDKATGENATPGIYLYKTAEGGVLLHIPLSEIQKFEKGKGSSTVTDFPARLKDLVQGTKDYPGLLKHLGVTQQSGIGQGNINFAQVSGADAAAASLNVARLPNSGSQAIG